MRKYSITTKMNKKFKLCAKFDDYILNNSYFKLSVEDFSKWDIWKSQLIVHFGESAGLLLYMVGGEVL